jgi:hypothetical protein
MDNSFANLDMGIRAATLVATLIIAMVGWRLPRVADQRRRRRFLALMHRELQEMAPVRLEIPAPDIGWTSLLSNKRKQFIHRAIFATPASARDFVLCLDADLAYAATQMWSTFDLAEERDVAPEACPLFPELPHRGVPSGRPESPSSRACRRIDIDSGSMEN